MGLFDFFKKKDSTPQEQEALDTGLEKTKDNFLSKITKVIAGKSTVDDDVLDELEEVLVTSDVGVSTTLKIIDRIQKRVQVDKYVGTSELNGLLRDEIQQLLAENNSNDFQSFEYGNHKPYVIMVVGVNGVGKTTTIGKLAHKLKAGRQPGGDRRCRYIQGRRGRPDTIMGRTRWCKSGSTGHGFRSCICGL